MSDAVYIKNLEAENDRLRIKIQNMSVPRGYVALTCGPNDNKLVLTLSEEAIEDVAMAFGMDMKAAIFESIVDSMRVELDKILEKKGIK